MLFNSLEFLIFLPTVFFFYWFVFQKNLRVQNLLLLLSSYVFYGWWDYRFLFLIFLSTVVDYVVELKIHYNNVKPIDFGSINLHWNKNGNLNVINSILPFIK